MYSGISRQDENFKACLGLELRADDDIEASLRVSCFQFGPKGLATMEAEPLPANINDSDEDEDGDDDDDPLGLGERKLMNLFWFIHKLNWVRFDNSDGKYACYVTNY